MAPKPKKPAGAAKGGKAAGAKAAKPAKEPVAEPVEAPPEAEFANAEDTSGDPLVRKQNVALSSINYDDLPGKGTFEATAMELINKSMADLFAIYVFYCKSSSECETLDKARVIHLTGVRKMVQHASLETSVFSIDTIVRIVAKCSGQPLPLTAKEVSEETTLGFSGFLSLIIQMAFYRANPRHGIFAPPPKEGKEDKKTSEPVPVSQCLKTFFSDMLPKLQKAKQGQFESVLRADSEANGVLTEYHEQLESWYNSLTNGQPSDDVYGVLIEALTSHSVLGNIDLTVPGGTAKRESTVTAAQVHQALIDAQRHSDFVFGELDYSLPTLFAVLARAGDRRFEPVSDVLPFAHRVRAFVQVVLGEIDTQSALEGAAAEIQTNQGSTGSPEEISQAREAALKKSWRECWRKMAFKDLVGYPLWETELHDFLQAQFSELHLMFTYYCGTSIQGSASIASATRIGIMEFIQIDKDCGLTNAEFKSEDLQRHFYVSNANEAMEKSGSADRHKVPKDAKKKGGGKNTGSVTATDRAKPSGKKGGKAGGKAAKPAGGGKADEKKVAVDQQLNLYEFVNCMVRIGFWRANPQYGSKYNKKELTPVPQAVEMLFTECLLPKAKRDTSHEFKETLLKDEAVQSVLTQYREKLQAWVRPILHRVRRPDNPNPQMTYKMWVALMDGPDPETRDILGPRPPCPKMVGEWFCQQESQITGDERTARKNQLTFKCALSIPKCRWNFLRSQTVDQMGADEASEGENSDYSTLDFNEMLECIARCGKDKYELCMNQWLPSHNKYVMTLADAVRSFIQNLLSEKPEEACMWELTVIRADRFDWQRNAKPLPDMKKVQFRLFQDCWQRMPLMDIHHFPLWEKGVHDLILKHFAALQRVFSHYTKGVSGIDSAADALEMELEEFHDFVKDAKLETKLVTFNVYSNMFAKANATNTAEAYEQRQAGRRNSVVQKEKEEKAKASVTNKSQVEKISAKPGAFDAVPDRFAPEFPLAGSSKKVKPDNRLVLFEFLACLVRMAFQRANPKFGQYDNKSTLVPLPGCLDTMLTKQVLPNAKQDQSSFFRDTIAKDYDVQQVLAARREELKRYYEEATRLTSSKGKMDSKLTMEAWEDIVKGYLTFKRIKGVWTLERAKFTSGEKGLGEAALIGTWSLHRESEITGDERTKELYACQLTMIQCKFAFLNSQNMDQMSAGDATNDDAMACLDLDEFTECIVRCGRDKYDEVKAMTLAQAVEGFIANLIGEKNTEGVIRDCTFIKAERYDWHISKPLKGQSLNMHRKWLDVWQNIEIADLHYFPLWEKDVHDCMQQAFPELLSIFSHYSKSIGGSGTAEDAVEMTTGEFKDLVKDTSLETKDFRFDVMTNLFTKANALNNNAARDQRKEERRTAASKQDGDAKDKSKKVKREASASKVKDQEKDMELVLYEFCALLVRISFWRANPFHGIIKLAQTLVPLPDCLYTMLHEVVLPNAQRDDSAMFKETLANDKGMQAVLGEYNDRLLSWWNKETQSMYLRDGERKLQYQQWQDILKEIKAVGIWEVHQESEIAGDERCKIKHKCSLSLPQVKFAFLNSQSLDQMSAGGASDTDAMTTLSWDEFRECVARIGIEKYKQVKSMAPAKAIGGFLQNLLGEANEEEVMVSATLIKAARFDWRRNSAPLEAQPLADHRKWLACWQRIEIQDMYHFPLWEKGVHDLLQKHFATLQSVFLGYTRSISETSAEDALEMNMEEFKDFVTDCGLETKQVNFALMTNMFVKANATNSAAVAQMHMEERRNAGGKQHEEKKKDREKVKGTNTGEEAVMDKELVLFEFLSLLVRISFQRANPTFGNFGAKRDPIMLPGCLQTMIEDEVLPRARRDTAMLFRDTVYAELAVQAVVEEYREKMDKWYKDTCADDTDEGDLEASSATSAKLGFKQWLRVCDRLDLVGIWKCHRESDICGDERTRGEYNWRLSMPQVKAAFMDSQSRDQMGVAQANAADEMAVLDFEEFLECVARCGVNKYAAIADISPAGAVRGMFQNILKEKEEEEVVISETYIHADRYEAEKLATPLAGETQADLQRWLDCWSRITIMDMHDFPLWEEEVHNMMQPLFKELTAIFLAYTRSISEDSAADALEMDMGEFHDFVVDVGLEAKDYGFDVMSNQFVKANATNTANVSHQHKQDRRNAEGKGNDAGGLREKKEKVKGTNKGEVAKKDQELVLYEFLGMLVRIAFWRNNPKHGLHGQPHDPALNVPGALSKTLNELILPLAKRDTSAEFRGKYMGDAEIVNVLTAYSDELKKWYKETTSNDAKETVISDKITFSDWLRVLDAQDLVGVWEVEQMSAITGDESTKGNVKCRFSIPQAKSAFLSSQREEIGVGQSSADEATNTLDFDEFKECVARSGIDKYRAIKVMKPSAAVKAMIQNMIGERDEVTVLREDTYIKAERFDMAKSMPLVGMPQEVYAKFRDDWGHLDLQGLYAFPTWEKDVHDALLENYVALGAIFQAYSRSLGEELPPSGSPEMSLDEFKDFVIDCEINNKDYTVEQMGPAFLKADAAASKGAYGPPPDKSLVLYEFLNVLTRVSFHSLNPFFGELVTPDGGVVDLVPVPMALKQTLDRVLRLARQQEEPSVFRETVLRDEAVGVVIDEARARLQEWWNKSLPEGAISMTLDQWVALAKKLTLVGHTSVERGSDVVGDPMAGELYTVRLSAPQAKAAFADSQRQDGGSDGGLVLDFDELLECVARCGVVKYAGVPQMKPRDCVRAMASEILGDKDEEANVHEHTYIKVERFDFRKPAEFDTSLEPWVAVWERVKVFDIYGFPLWEQAVHDGLLAQFSELQSIFAAYAAGSLEGSATDMDFDEFNDFVIDCDLPTKEYGFDTMQLQYEEANKGSTDKVLEMHEFLAMLIRISFARANPQAGMLLAKKSDNFKAKADSPLPDCLLSMIQQFILPNARRNNAAEFKKTAMVDPKVVEVLDKRREALSTWWEMTSGGKDAIDIRMWEEHLDGLLLFSDIQVEAADGSMHRCRFSVPQAKAAFCASCAEPKAGMAPPELLEIVARCGIEKYKAVSGMSLGQKVEGFIKNLLKEADEEVVVLDAVSGGVGPRGPVAAKGGKAKAAPAARPQPARPQPVVEAPPAVPVVEEPPAAPVEEPVVEEPVVEEPVVEEPVVEEPVTAEEPAAEEPAAEEKASAEEPARASAAPRVSTLQLDDLPEYATSESEGEEDEEAGEEE